MRLLWPPRRPRVRQHDATDCGAACLSAIAEFYGLRVPIARIRQHAATDQRGTTLLGMMQAATRLGFAAKGVRGPLDSLPAVPTPAIAHVLTPQGMQHFVVVYAASARAVTLMDPADGRVHHRSAEQFGREWTGVLLLLAPAEHFHAGDQRGSGLRRLWSLARPHRAALTQALVGAAVYTLLGMASALYIQHVVDHVLVSGNRNLLNLLSVGMLLLIALQVYIGSAKSLLTLRAGQQIDAALIVAYYRHLLHLPQRFFDTMRVGEIVSRVGDAVKIRAFVSEVSLGLVVDTLVVAFSLALMLASSWKLGLLVAGALPLYALLYWATNRVNRQSHRAIMEAAAELESHLVESVGAMGTLKRFGADRMWEVRTEGRLVRLLRPVYRAGTTGIAAGAACEWLNRTSVVALLWAGAGLVISQGLTPGELMSLYALLGHLNAPIAGLIHANRSVQDALIATDRLFEILDLEREADGDVQLPRGCAGDLRFERVRFRYGAREQVLNGLDLVVPRGAITAVVGESGCGKSTLIALLQRVHRPDAGRIRIGSLELAQVREETLRRAIAAVPQRLDLFAGSIVDNVALGDFEPDMARVLDACEMVGLRDFVESLPAGFRSPVGEHGVNLSGGQRQRLAIARALYRQPEILLLDEATAALDAVSELCIQNALAALRRRGVTIVLVAHRLSTVVHADKIAVLEEGRVVEEGTHPELILRRGRYFRLWSHQLGGASGAVAPGGALVAAAGAAATGEAEQGPAWLRSI